MGRVGSTFDTCSEPEKALKNSPGSGLKTQIADGKGSRIKAMVELIVDGMSILLAVIAIGIALRKWHIIRDRQLFLSTIKIALNERKSLWIGMLAGFVYLALFMILGGKGGRIHVLFGRVIFNTTAVEVSAGLILASLVMVSMSLFAYNIQLMGLKKTGEEGGIGLFGAFLAVLAAFCP